MDGQLLLLIDFSKDGAPRRQHFQMMSPPADWKSSRIEFGAALKLVLHCDYIPQKCITGSTPHPTESVFWSTTKAAYSYPPFFSCYLLFAHRHREVPLSLAPPEKQKKSA